MLECNLRIKCQYISLEYNFGIEFQNTTIDQNLQQTNENLDVLKDASENPRGHDPGMSDTVARGHVIVMVGECE